MRYSVFSDLNYLDIGCSHILQLPLAGLITKHFSSERDLNSLYQSARSLSKDFCPLKLFPLAQRDGGVDP